MDSPIHEDSYGLHIDGLVRSPRFYHRAELAALPRVRVVEEMHTTSAPPREWSGVRLWDVLQLAGVLPEANYVRVMADGYGVPLLLPDAQQAILADSLDGHPLTAEQGAPWRLYVPNMPNRTNVKGVARLHLTDRRGSSVAERIQRARQLGRLAKP
jgi:DMSO/TMAO reductase YedYZ molybdopterin-dependent catalytic subunit